MNEDKIFPSNELLDRQNIVFLLKTLKTGAKLEDHICQYFFAICQANDLIDKYMKFYGSGKAEYWLYYCFWNAMSMDLCSLLNSCRKPCLVEKFQREYTNKSNYKVRAIMYKLCRSLNLNTDLPEDFFYHLRCQEDDFIKKIKLYLELIKNNNFTSDTFIEVIPDEYRSFMFSNSLYEGQKDIYKLTDRGIKALRVPYTETILKCYDLVAFMEALDEPMRSRRM